MKIDGRCLCGAVAFEAEVNPSQVFICHCTDCQTQSGTSFRTVARAEPGTFRLTSGGVKLYEKRAESGATRRLAFCPECGTSIYGAPAEGEKGWLSLRVGVLRQRDVLRPVAQVWCRSSQAWLDDLRDLPRIDSQPGRS
jgi:hypothetical protein